MDTIEHALEHYAADLPEESLSPEERAWLIEERAYALLDDEPLEENVSDEVSAPGAILCRRVAPMRLEHVAFAIAIASVFVGIGLGAIAELISRGDGGKLGWLIVVSGQLCAAALGVSRWSTFYGKFAVLWSVALPTVAMISHALFG